MEQKFAYIKRYKSVGQILWEKDGLYKITFNSGYSVITEIFIEEEFEFRDSL